MKTKHYEVTTSTGDGNGKYSTLKEAQVAVRMARAKAFKAEIHRVHGTIRVPVTTLKERTNNKQHFWS